MILKQKIQNRWIISVGVVSWLMLNASSGWCVFKENSKSEKQNPKEAASSVDPDTECTFSREYITTLEYLRSEKALAVPEADARKTAEKVALGCTGAAQRFIRVASTLGRSGVAANDSLKDALEFSGRSDVETETFLAVFLKAFLQEYLDLDLKASLRMARSLAAEFQGDIPTVREDFEKILKFCVDQKQLDLPRPQCGSFAARIAHLGENFNGGVADSFLRSFEFIRSESGPGLTTAQALQLSEQLVGGGRNAAENFIQAFRYGVSKKGLAEDSRGAIQFATRMALLKAK
jgi:hypothetical protein